MNVSKLLDFEKLHNIRDLGGITTADGRRVISGKLIRSGHLSELSDSDREKLVLLTDTVVDFRTDRERSEKPDVEITGIRYIHIPILDSLTAGITREEAADQDIIARASSEPCKARGYMCSMYHAFAESDFSAAQYSRFIRLLMEPREKALLWHCTAGKDRVGVGCAIILEILGAERDDIIDDYLRTNEYLREDVEFLTEYVKSQSGGGSETTDEALKYLFGAERDYIEEYYQTIDSKYGSFDRFIREGLKLTEEDISRLRSLYLSADELTGASSGS